MESLSHSLCKTLGNIQWMIAGSLLSFGLLRKEVVAA